MTAFDKYRMFYARSPFSSVRSAHHVSEDLATEASSPLSLAVSRRFTEGIKIMLDGGVHYQDAMSCARHSTRNRDLEVLQLFLVKAPYPGRLLSEIWAEIYRGMFDRDVGFGRQVLDLITWDVAKIADCLDGLSTEEPWNVEEAVFKAAVQALVDMKVSVSGKEVALTTALLLAIYTSDVETAELLCLHRASMKSSLVETRTKLKYDASDTLLHFTTRLGDEKKHKLCAHEKPPFGSASQR